MLPALIFLFLLSSVSGWAQETGRIKEMKVALWPEYDDPRALGVYSGQFADGAAPKSVRFLIPKRAEINQACSLTAAGEHLCQLYNVNEKGDFLEISYAMPEPRFLLEFYFPLDIQGANKGAVLPFQSLYPVDSLDAEVMKPLRASEFRATPQPASFARDDQGLEYGHVSLGKFEVGKKIEVKINYVKEDAKPSVAKRAQPATVASTGRANFLPIMGGLLGAAALLFAGYMVASRRQGLKESRRPATSPRPAPVQKKGQLRFCSECGAELSPGGKFCPGCGRDVTSS